MTDDEQRDPDGSCNVCGSYEAQHRHGPEPGELPEVFCPFAAWEDPEEGHPT